MNSHLHPLVALASLVVIVAGMQAIAEIMSMVLLALMLVLCILPLTDWLLKKGMGRGLATLVTILILLGGSLLLSAAIGGSASQLADKGASYETKLMELVDISSAWLGKIGISSESVSLERVAGFATDFVRGIISAFGNSVIVVLMMLFLIIDGAGVLERIRKGELSSTSWHYRVTELGTDVRKYVNITAMTGLITSVGNLLLMLILGVEFALLWAFLSFFFNFIPNIGFILSVIPPAVIAILDYGVDRAILVLIGFVIINSLVENVIKPRFLGKELDISLSLIFVSLLFWGWVLGMVGTIMAVPLTLVAKKLWQETFSDPSTTT